MYLGVVLEHVKEQLINSALSGLITSKNGVQIMVSDKPKALSDGTTVVVHPRMWEAGSPAAYDNVHGEKVTFGVTVITKTLNVPQDQIGEALFVGGVGGLDKLSLYINIINNIIDKVTSSNNTLESKYRTRVGKLPPTIRNTLIPPGKSLSVTDQFRWISTDAEPVPRYADFFNSKLPDAFVENEPVGYSLTSVFTAPLLLRAVVCAT